MCERRSEVPGERRRLAELGQQIGEGSLVPRVNGLAMEAVQLTLAPERSPLQRSIDASIIDGRHSTGTSGSESSSSRLCRIRASSKPSPRRNEVSASAARIWPRSSRLSRSSTRSSAARVWLRASRTSPQAITAQARSRSMHARSDASGPASSRALVRSSAATAGLSWR